MDLRSAAVGLLIAAAAPAALAEEPARSFDVFGDDRAAGSPRLPRLMVLVVPRDETVRGQALRLMRESTRQLAAAQGMEPAALIPTLDRDADEARKSDLREGLQAVERGMAAFEELELGEAGAELDTAVSLLLSHLDELRTTERRILDEALFTLGTTALFEGQAQAADGVFVALSLLSPHYEPDAARYPSNVVGRYGEVKATVDSRPTGALEVLSKPAGASVFVDGVFRGVTPLEVEDLADGQHSVVLDRMGYLRFGVLSPVTAGRSSRIEVDLPPTEAAAFAEGIGAGVVDDPERAVALGARLALSRLALLILERSMSGQHQVRGLWVDVDAAEVVASVPPTRVAEAPDVAAPTIIGAIAAAVEGAPAPESTPQVAPPVVAEVTAPEPSRPSRPILEQWWFWAIVGGVAVAAAGTAAIAASGGGPDRPPDSRFILGF